MHSSISMTEPFLPSASRRFTLFTADKSSVLSQEDLNVEIIVMDKALKINSEADKYLLSIPTVEAKESEVNREFEKIIKRYELQIKKYLEIESVAASEDKVEDTRTERYAKAQKTLEDFRDQVIHKEIKIKAFYDKLAKKVKNQGYLENHTDGVYDASLYNCKALADIKTELTAENKSNRDFRIMSALAILPAVGFALPYITKELFSDDFTYKHTAATAVFMLVIASIIFATEYYRSRNIHSVSEKAKSLLVTTEGNSISLFDLKCAHTHAVCLRLAASNILTDVFPPPALVEVETKDVGFRRRGM